MIRNGDTYYRCLLDMQPVLSSQKLGDLMRVVEYEEKHQSGDATSEMVVVECRLGEIGCRPIKTIRVKDNWSLPPMFYQLMDFGVRYVGQFGSLGDWYHQNMNKVHEDRLRTR